MNNYIICVETGTLMTLQSRTSNTWGYRKFSRTFDPTLHGVVLSQLIRWYCSCSMQWVSPFLTLWNHIATLFHHRPSSCPLIQHFQHARQLEKHAVNNGPVMDTIANTVTEIIAQTRLSWEQQNPSETNTTHPHRAEGLETLWHIGIVWHQPSAADGAALPPQEDSLGVQKTGSQC